MRRSTWALAAAIVAGSVGSSSRARADDAACIAAAESAITAQKSGKLRDALRQLAACATSACPAEIADECSKRIATVTAATPTLILAVKDASGNDVLAATVTLDGAELKDAVSGRAVALDPGEHKITVTADGFPAASKTLILLQGEKDRRETVILIPPVAAPPPPPPPRWNKWRTVSVVTGGVGVVGLAVGAAFGAFASSAQSRQKTDCGSAASACRNYPQGLEDYNVAKQDAAASTGALVAGGVLLGAGVVLWFVAPKPSAPAPDAEPGPAPVALEGFALRFGAVSSGTGLSLRGAF